MTPLSKILYKIGLLAAWGARTLWSDSRSSDGGSSVTLARKNVSPHIFFITSTINTSPRHLGQDASLIRSVYSPDQRFEQTLKTVESVRQKAPGALIFLLENSTLLPHQRTVLEAACDQLISFSGDKVAVDLRDGPNKNAAEAYVLLKALHELKDYDYETLFKLSGRYLLSARFDLARFPLDRFGFLRSEGVVSTRLYSVPASLISIYKRQLKVSYLATKFGVSIEDVISRGLDASQIKLLDPIGVSGPLAVDSGVFIDE